MSGLFFRLCPRSLLVLASSDLRGLLGRLGACFGNLLAGRRACARFENSFPLPSHPPTRFASAFLLKQAGLSRLWTQSPLLSASVPRPSGVALFSKFRNLILNNITYRKRLPRFQHCIYQSKVRETIQAIWGDGLQENFPFGQQFGSLRSFQ